MGLRSVSAFRRCNLAHLHMANEKPEIVKASPLEIHASENPVLIVEFRGQSPDVIKWTDKKDGKAKEVSKLNISAECGVTSKQITLEETAPHGSPPGFVVPAWPYKRGDLVLVSLQNYVSSRETGVKGRVISHSLFRAAS